MRKGDCRQACDLQPASRERALRRHFEEAQRTQWSALVSVSVSNLRLERLAIEPTSVRLLPWETVGKLQ